MAWYNIFYKPKNNENMKDENPYSVPKIGEFNSPLQNKKYDRFEFTSDDVRHAIDLLHRGVYSQEEINNFPFQINLTGKQINDAFSKAVDYCNEKHDLKLP